MNSLEESDIYQKIGAEVRRLAQKFGIDDIELASEVSTLTKLSKELAIEKTNKRWREKIGEKAEKRLWTNTVANNMHVVKKYHQGINDLVSDLLEDKKTTKRRVDEG